MRQLRKQSVVIAAPTPQPMAAAIKSHSRHDGHIDITIRREHGALRFGDTESPLAQVVLATVDTQAHRVGARHLRQKHALACLDKTVERIAGIHLVGK